MGQPDGGKVDNPARRFLLKTAQSARDASALVRAAWAKYRSSVDYGIAGLDLPKVAALIEAKMPTRLYYTSYRNNAFDTHVFQPDLHHRLLTYASDAVSAFLKDVERIGRADDVVVMIFSEFGRRVPENVNLGTDHGTANLMFVAGNQVKGGHYGKVPSLAQFSGLDFNTHERGVRLVAAIECVEVAVLLDRGIEVRPDLVRFRVVCAWGTNQCPWKSRVSSSTPSNWKNGSRHAVHGCTR